MEKLNNLSHNSVIWQYKTYKFDANYSQRDDKKNDFTNHDDLQSQAIEYEYQQCLSSKQGDTHTFLLSGNFKKFRNNHEYSVIFEDINDSQTWYKINIKSNSIRPLKRINLNQKMNDIQQQQNIEPNRKAVKKVVWQYKVYNEDGNFKNREDKFCHYVNHDDKQSEIIEKEFQAALFANKQSHQFVLSGDWAKDRNNWEYNIDFENLKNPDTWTKQNVKSLKKRPICRIEIWSEVIERVLDRQKECLEDIIVKCKKESENAEPLLQERINKLGLKSTLQELKKYYRDHAPIIIHVHLDKYLKFFVNDTQYRNQFETGSSSGSKDLEKRMGWEFRMFNDHYEGSESSVRPKYGVINFTNNPIGDPKCISYGYGRDYLALSDSIRNRCTFTNKDSSYDDSVIGTLYDCCHVMMAFSDDELIASSLAAQQQIDCNEVKMMPYKEVQIHGPIEFDKDIISVHVSEQNSTNQQLRNLLEQFKQKANIGVVYMGDDIKKQQHIDEVKQYDDDYGNR